MNGPAPTASLEQTKDDRVRDECNAAEITTIDQFVGTASVPAALRAANRRRHLGSGTVVQSRSRWLVLQ